MSTGDLNHEKPFVAEANAENGRSYVPASKKPEEEKSKFEKDAKAWLVAEDDEWESFEVIIESKKTDSNGDFFYQVKDKDDLQIVKNDSEGDWFPESQLKVKKPTDSDFM